MATEEEDMKKLLLIVTHGLVGLAGFAAGIYALPILTAPDAPSAADVRQLAAEALYTGSFRRDLAGSDALHWGEGTVALRADSVSLAGRIAPGPDYRLYLVPEFVEDEAGFERVKARALEVGPVKTFDNFVVPLPTGIDLTRYNTVVVWCESFGEFITAAQYL
jgi:hypothetical protein